MLGEALVQEQSEPGEAPRGYKAVETLGQILVELGMHMMVADTLASSVEVGTLFEGLGLSVCSPLLWVLRGTETAVGHQAPGIREAQQGCRLQVDSGDCRVA